MGEALVYVKSNTVDISRREEREAFAHANAQAPGKIGHPARRRGAPGWFQSVEQVEQVTGSRGSLSSSPPLLDAEMT